MGNSFRAKEKGAELNRRNSLVFKKIQDMHTVSLNFNLYAHLYFVEKRLLVKMVANPKKHPYNSS